MASSSRESTQGSTRRQRIAVRLLCLLFGAALLNLPVCLIFAFRPVASVERCGKQDDASSGWGFFHWQDVGVERMICRYDMTDLAYIWRDPPVPAPKWVPWSAASKEPNTLTLFWAVGWPCRAFWAMNREPIGTGPQPWQHAIVLKDGEVVLPFAPIWSGIALNTAFWLIPALPFLGIRSWRRRRRRARGWCIDCGYDLHGNVNATACPECGHPTRGSLTKAASHAW